MTFTPERITATRTLCAKGLENLLLPDTLLDALDEIERLRNVLEQIASEGGGWGSALATQALGRTDG